MDEVELSYPREIIDCLEKYNFTQKAGETFYALTLKTSEVKETLIALCKNLASMILE